MHAVFNFILKDSCDTPKPSPAAAVDVSMHAALCCCQAEPQGAQGTLPPIRVLWSLGNIYFNTKFQQCALLGCAGYFKSNAMTGAACLLESVISIVSAILKQRLPRDRLLDVLALRIRFIFLIDQGSFKADGARKCDEAKRKRKIEGKACTVILRVA